MVVYITKARVNLCIRRQTAPSESLDSAIQTNLQDRQLGRYSFRRRIKLTFRSTSSSLRALSTGDGTEPLAGCSLISFFAGGRDIVVLDHWLVG